MSQGLHNIYIIHTALRGLRILSIPELSNVLINNNMDYMFRNEKNDLSGKQRSRTNCMEIKYYLNLFF